MNAEIGTEAAQFLEKEYINGIFIAVQRVQGMKYRVVKATRWRTSTAVPKPKRRLPIAVQLTPREGWVGNLMRSCRGLSRCRNDLLT